MDNINRRNGDSAARYMSSYQHDVERAHAQQAVALGNLWLRAAKRIRGLFAHAGHPAARPYAAR